LADGIANQFLVVFERKIHRVSVRGVRTMLAQPRCEQKAGRAGEWKARLVRKPG
jgi:hypothetical protein